MQIMKKTILITGASRGLGKELAKKYLSEGYFVVMVSKNENLGNYKEIIDCYDSKKYKIYFSDLKVKNEAFYERIKNEVGIPDILILNSAIVNPINVLEYSSELIKETIETNLMANIYLIEAFIKDFIKRENGIICGISSLADARGFSGAGFYTASKAALSNYLEGLAIELKKFNVDVINIKPGLLKTDMSENLKINNYFKYDTKKAAEKIFRAIKRKKIIYAFLLYQTLLIKLINLMPINIFVKLFCKK